jgi:tRNA pseudouridine38-40 synthase
MGRTVQGEMEYALEGLTGSRRPVVAAGRTDSGVHATGQLAAVTVPPGWTPPELRRALNANLPHDIWVQSVRKVSPGFHPRYAATARSYRYQVGLTEGAFSPFARPWCWPLIRELDVDLLHRGAAFLPGDWSFKSFAKVGQEHRGDRCVVSEARWVRWEDLGVALEIRANRFLHHMVRYLVGTMVDVARSRRPLSDVAELLSDPATPLTMSPPAPPQGLFLTRVHYTDPDSKID